MSTRVICLTCSAEIPPDDVNVSEGAAYCRACGTLSALADILDDQSAAVSPAILDPDDPPAGCSIRDNGVETTLRASARSASGIAGGLFITLFWNGIVSVFVLVALAETIRHIFGTVPSWFPGPNFSSGGNANGMMTLGFLIFFWIFLLPFISIGLILACAFLTALIGRVEVRVRHGRGIAFTGVGPIGWKRRFDAGAVKSVIIGRTTWKENDRSKPVVVIEADRTVRVGSILSDTRRAWLTAALRRLLL